MDKGTGSQFDTAATIDISQAPMGANLAAAGATFRLWAPAALSVSVAGTFNNWTKLPLAPGQDGYWSNYVPGVNAGDEYKFWVDGTGSSGWKRDPYARSLTRDPGWPHSNCEVLRRSDFPWHDQDHRPPAFSDLVIYQLHIGAFYSVDENGNDQRANRAGRFLDVLSKLEYLVDLGVNAVQFLPIQEFSGPRSLGYSGTDCFSPEMDYSVAPDDPEFATYLAEVNALLARKGRSPLTADDIDDQPKQLMAVIELMHLYGLSVIFDMVFNHAGGGLDDESLYFLDREPDGDQNRSLYFTNQEMAGGLAFAYWKQEVRQFLIDNAGFFFDEYHVDGYRFDEVSAIDRFGGWNFLLDLTDTLRSKKPEAPLIAEYWADQSVVVRPRGDGGAGFDSVISSGLRNAVRAVLADTARGADAPVNLDTLAAALYPPFGAGWRQVQQLENQDIVRIDNKTDRAPRIAALADSTNARSWYARSRARVANGLLLTAPGIPCLFMGQEFLEDKYWSDNPGFFTDTLIWWDGLDSDPTMQDFRRFMKELIALRRSQEALRGNAMNVFHVHNGNRVLAFHRWIEGIGADVVIAVNLNETTWYDYALGFPGGGHWREVFNSDVYDNWVNPATAGNGGGIDANGPPMHGMSNSAGIVIPANGFVVFTR